MQPPNNETEANKLAQRLCRELFIAQQRVIEQHLATQGCDEAALQRAVIGAAVAFLATTLTVCNVADPEQLMRDAVRAPLTAKLLRNFANSNKGKPS